MALIFIRFLPFRLRQWWFPLIRIRNFLFIIIGFGVLSFSYLVVIHQQANANRHLIQLQISIDDDSQQQTTTTDPPDIHITTNHNTFISSAKLISHKTKKVIQPFKSSCGPSADERGPHQKVIGYTIYGDFMQKSKADRYVEPLRKTIEAIPSVYPGWIVRIHHNLKREEHETSSWKILQKAVAGHNVDLCNVTEVFANRKLNKSIQSAMLWRWLPLLDGLVDAFMSRDADSLILPRERYAVAEWLISDKTFHVMRDHPAHCIVMLGGLWGVKLSDNRTKITTAFESLFRNENKYLNNYNLDQRLLNKYIWPLAKSDHMAHDSYCCIKFKDSRPFPSLRTSQMEFVGQIQQKKQLIKIPCPQQCRHVDAKPEWKYC